MSADLAIGSPRTHPAIGSPRARADVGSTLQVLPEPGAAEAVRRASEEAVHLAPEAMPRWRALLESHWRARLERVTELSLAYHDAEEAGSRTDGRLLTGAQQARPLLRQAVAERRELAEIEAALSRLTSGCFGRCERCGGAMSAVRLARFPQARYCGTCEG
jgi:RNA polymerase-binding transcription factor DksA